MIPHPAEGREPNLSGLGAVAEKAVARIVEIQARQADPRPITQARLATASWDELQNALAICEAKTTQIAEELQRRTAAARVPTPLAETWPMTQEG